MPPRRPPSALAPAVALALTACGAPQPAPAPPPAPAPESAPAPEPAPAPAPAPESDAAPVAYYCFTVRWDDGGHNSECVRDREHCEGDLRLMRGYATPDAVFRGCFPVPHAFCYDATGELCFAKMEDCEQSHEPIPGGPCEVRR